MIVEIDLIDQENISRSVSGLGDCFFSAKESLIAAAKKTKAVLPDNWEHEAYKLYSRLSHDCYSLMADRMPSDMTMEIYRIAVRVRFRHLNLPTQNQVPFIVSSDRYAAFEPQEVYDV